MIILKHEADLVQTEFSEPIGAKAPDVRPFHEDASCVWPEDPGKDAEQGRFPASGWTHDIEHFPQIGLQADFLEGGRFRIAFTEPLDQSACFDGCNRHFIL